MSRNSTDGNLGDVLIWANVPVLLIGLSARDGNWPVVAGVACFLLLFAAVAGWLWVTTLKLEATARLRARVTELVEVDR